MTLRLRGSTSGYAEINAPAVAGDNSLTLPTTTGTIRITNPSGVDGDYTVATGATISGSTNTITASTNGEERLRIDSSGDIEISQGKNLTWVYEGGSTHRARIRAESTDALIFENGSGNTEQLRITSAGNVGIGTDSTTSKLHINGTVRSDEGYTVYPPSDSNYAFATRNAANDQWTAFIEANGKATFAGNVVLSTSGSGIDFSATADGSGTSTSELLDDYEEGTFTPTFNSTVTYTGSLTGNYTKIGRVVYISIGYSNGTFTSATGGVAKVAGLPFTVNSDSILRSAFSIGYQEAFDTVSNGGYFEDGTNNMVFYDTGTPDTNSFSNGTGRYLLASGFYMI